MSKPNWMKHTEWCLYNYRLWKSSITVNRNALPACISCYGEQMPAGEDESTTERYGIKRACAEEAAKKVKAMEIAMQGLPMQEREVVRMYYFDRLTVPEISKSLGKSKRTVGRRKYNALKKVYGILRKS